MSDALIPVIDLTLADRIDAVLPQTQCTKCGYQGCRPYAEAIAAGDAINKCPPGGAVGIQKLAQLLDRPVIPLDTTHGQELPQLMVAYIREPECIGCTKCIQACPVDAIFGAAKLMHTIASDICTGCELCVAPCPVNCIEMIPAPYQNLSADDTQKKSDLSRTRFQRRNTRLQKIADAKIARRKISSEKSDAVVAALQLAQEKQKAYEQASQQSPEVLREKLEKTLVAAQERLERAEAKVLEAERKYPEQVAALTARREDMRFKLNETQKKLAALDIPPVAISVTAQAALEKMQAMRQRKPDNERFAAGLLVIDSKIQTAREQLPSAEGDEAFFLQEDIERLEKKRATLLEEMGASEQPNNT